jgi:asparagine synthase (glutamine-hydrolysing)
VNAFVQDIAGDDFNSLLLADQKLVLSNDMLTKVDMMSMMHGLEVRPPFLDHHVVEFVNALPIHYKIIHSERKIIMKEAFEKQLPPSVFQRPKKGFEVPLEKWLRGDLKPLVKQMLDPERIRAQEIFHAAAVADLLNDFYNRNRATHTSLLYSMLVFQVWYEGL